MKIIIKSILGIYALSVLFTGCIEDKSNITKVDLGSDSIYIVVADTIINDVIIKSPDKDEWIDYTLRNLNKTLLVDNIFKSVYEEKLIPYEFFSDNPLSISEVIDLENNPEFSRDKIAKVQFEEAWYYDPEHQKMVKKVHSIMLAYEIHNSLGEIKGYKPAFKVKFE